MTPEGIVQDDLNMKLKKKLVMRDVRKHVFSVMVENKWNLIEQDIRVAKDIHRFKEKHNKKWSSLM